MQAQRTFQLVAMSLALATGVPAAQDAAPVYDPGNGTTLPVVVRQVQANYTPAAMKARLEGTVVLQSVVLSDGTVGDVRVLQSLDTEHGLDEQAMAAMKQWIFRPGQRDGKPVAVRIHCEMTFTLR
jgi:protein TonB